MIELHFHASPNPMKVLLMLEECGLDYKIVPVDTFKGQQHAPSFVKLSPNAKVPVIDDDGVSVFDSNAILLYLADRAERFAPPPGTARAELLSWLFFVASGLSPFSGQAVHFLHMCPEDIPYAKNRYLREVERHYAVMDRRLANAEWLAGEEYSIADMAAWGWLNLASYFFGDAALSSWPNLARLHAKVSHRPAAIRAVEAKDQLTFKQEFDEETTRALFPQNYAA